MLIPLSVTHVIVITTMQTVNKQCINSGLGLTINLQNNELIFEKFVPTRNGWQIVF